MTELQWTPRQIGELTVSQLTCLAQDKPPGHQSIKSPEEYAAFQRNQAQADKEWAGK